MQETLFDSWAGKICWRRDRLPTPVFLAFPCGSAGKESTCSVGDLGSIPGLGDPWRRERLPTPVFWLGGFHGLSDFHFPRYILTCRFCAVYKKEGSRIWTYGVGSVLWLKEMTGKTVKVWACLGCWDKVPKTGQLKWQKLVISQLWSQKSEVKVSAGLVPSEPESEVSSSFSPSHGGFADRLWHVLTYRCFVPSSDSSSHEFALCMCPCSNFPIYKDSSHTGASWWLRW